MLSRLLRTVGRLKKVHVNRVWPGWVGGVGGGGGVPLIIQ